MAGHEVFVNVDKSSESVWETKVDLFNWSQDHGVENLHRIGPVMILRGNDFTLDFFNPTNRARIGISQDEILAI